MLEKGGGIVQLGLTWPLQRLLRTPTAYGESGEKGYCWDAHCITLHGRSSLLLVHCHSRFTLVRYDLSPSDWKRFEEIASQEVQLGLLDAGIREEAVTQYISAAGEWELTRTHGRREVAFLNRAWEDVLSADLLVDQASHRQPILNQAVNSRLCRCAGEDEVDTAQAHLERYFARWDL